MILKPRAVKLSTRTGTSVNRLLPNANLRRIGAWIFLDHFGPYPQTEQSMQVARHPHTGLQTVTWLLEGDVEHADSEQNLQRIQPNQLNLMTAGSGIAHSEISTKQDNKVMHGVQLWTALPNEKRNIKPFFEHHANLPTRRAENYTLAVFLGEYQELKSPATAFTPLLGAELELEKDLTLELNPAFEYGFLPLTGAATIQNQLVEQGQLLTLETQNHEVKICTEEKTKILILGGEPFTEQLVMWWNFVARTNEEIAEMQHRWNHDDKWIPHFEDRLGGWIPAPQMPNVTLKAR